MSSPRGSRSSIDRLPSNALSTSTVTSGSSSPAVVAASGNSHLTSTQRRSSNTQRHVTWSGDSRRRRRSLKTPEGKRRGSLTGSLPVNQDSVKRRYVTIWPEWNDADIGAEKWDVQHRAGKSEQTGKNAKAATTPVAVQQVVNFFDDPEGKCELPAGLKAYEWKRPQDFITDKTPVVVDVEGMNSFELMSANELVHESETMRWITSQITALWNNSEIKPVEGAPPPPAVDPNALLESMFTHGWRPWEHIYALARPSRGSTINYPQYNAYGKYVVKLYFMGCWRKLIIDDNMPFDQSGNLLLPSTALRHELWPMLLTKALLKVAALDYTAGGSSCEFGDFSVIHCLTGWLPEVIPLQSEHMNEIWTFLKASLPEFTLPEPPPDLSQDPTVNADGTVTKDEKTDKQDKPDAVKVEKPGRESKDKKELKGKDDRKNKNKDKDENRLKAPLSEEPVIPNHPEMVVFATYQGVPKTPARITLMDELANSYELLRQHGFSHCYPHPVLVSQSRSCPLIPPPPKEKVPAWKMVRPRIDANAADQGEAAKPIQCLRLTSPFYNYKVPFTESPGETKEKLPDEVVNAAAVSTESNNAADTSKGTSQTQSALATRGKESTTLPEDFEALDKSGSAKKKQKSKADAIEVADKRVVSSKASKRLGGQSVREGSKLAAVDGKAKKADGFQAATDDQTKPSNVNAEVDETKHLNGSTVDTESTEEKKSEPKSPETWIDFDVMCRCFRTLIVYHKWNTYPCNHHVSDLRTQPAQPTQPAEKDKKVDKKDKVTVVSATTEEKEKSPYFLFVDSLKPTEIVVSMSALCHWNDPVPPPAAANTGPEPKSSTKQAAKTERNLESRMGDAAHQPAADNAAEHSAAAGGDPAAKGPLQPGLLLAEQFSWKSLVTDKPVLQIRTTGTRASVLCLPEGRHVLRFSVAAPLGYQLQLCSATSFVFGDEEKVIAELTKESCRFVDVASKAMHLLGDCLVNFNDKEKRQQAMCKFLVYHCPFLNDAAFSKLKHHKVVLEAIYASVKKLLADAQLLSPEMSFAWRVFNFDATTKNPFGLLYGTVSRPKTGEQIVAAATGATSSDRASSTGGGKKAAAKKQHVVGAETVNPDVPEGKVDYWRTKEITDADRAAAVRIQSQWRGYYVRKIKKAMEPGTEECARVQEQLTKAWTAIEPAAESCGTIFFRKVLQLSPEVLPKYSFSRDEWNRITYVDYQGVHPEHPPNTWFVVFREVFHATEDILCIPKLTCSLPACSLHVINNDTGLEVPRVFGKVSPHVYKRNSLGYTFIADGKSPVGAQSSPCHWRMRLIGSAGNLLTPTRNDVSSSFSALELHEYYIPNDYNIILRYSVRVTQDHLATIQLSTSKSDVRFKLTVIDNGEELLSCEGQGHVILPAVIFRRDPPSLASVEDIDPAAPSSSTHSSSRTSRPRVSSQSRGVSVRNPSTERYSPRLDASPDRIWDAGLSSTPHKYYIQAEVLHGTWPLSQSQWAFVQTLKENEMNEMKDKPTASVTAVERPSSSSVRSKSKDKSGGGGRQGKTNVAKEKEKEKLTNKSSSPFNENMPNWTLRIVSDADMAETIEAKKDTERIDAIRAMKMAWEEAEPGRAAKAKQSRLKYLSSHVVKCEDDGDDEAGAGVEADGSVTTAANVGSNVVQSVSSSSAVPMATIQAQSSNISVESKIPSGSELDATLTNIPPPPKKPKERLLPLDLEPFLRKTTEVPRLLDENEIQRQMNEKRVEIQEYRRVRSEISERREHDRKLRNAMKVAQLQLYEQMQVNLENARAAVRQPREIYRQRLLEAEKAKLDAIAAQEAALRAENEKNSPPTTKRQKSPKSPRSPAAGRKKK